MMEQSVTSREQSQRLVDAGLGIDTADMLYTYGNNIPEVKLRHCHKKDTPAWSLGRLMEMLPLKITSENLTSYLEIVPVEEYKVWEWEVRWMCNGFVNPFAYCPLLKRYIRFRDGNPIEAITQAIEWLVKHDYELN